GTRGEEVKTSADGRVFVSQSGQVDVLGPRTAPHVVSVNPPPSGVVALPLASISVTFDQDMLADDPADPGSVLDPDNYQLQSVSAGRLPTVGVAYAPASRTAVLTSAARAADHSPLHVPAAAESSEGVALAGPFDSDFDATADLSSVLSVRFSQARSDRHA